MAEPHDGELSEDDVVSPESIWRITRSLAHPITRPRRYFHDVHATPRQYLKPKQALGLQVAALWLIDQRLAENLAAAKVDLHAHPTALALLRGFLALFTIWATPFAARLGSSAVRQPLSWSDATRLAAFLVPWGLVSAALQGTGSAMATGGSLLGYALAWAWAYRRLTGTTIRQAFAATALAFILSIVVTTVVGLVFGTALALSTRLE